MRITTKEVRELTRILDDLIEEYKEQTTEEKRDWRTYEQQLARRIRRAVRNLDPLVDEAISAITTIKGETRGRKPILTLKQKTLLLLLKHLVDKSNREMSAMLVLFSLLTDVDVSYKTVERLYSDWEVSLVLHNMHVLMLKMKGVKDPDSAGDGTGYALTVKKHYATVAQKLKDKAKEAKESKRKGKKSKSASKKHTRKQFIYAFAIMDLDTRLYIGYGTSLKSEKEAFDKAIAMAEATGIGSLRLDRYFSAQMYVEFLEEKFGEEISVYLIPKKNATVKGPWKWKRMLYQLKHDPNGFLHEYFKRNQSESAFSEDKRRLGWGIRQRREDRIVTSNFCTAVWHNLFWMEA